MEHRFTSDNLLARKLSSFTEFSAGELSALDAIWRSTRWQVAAEHDIAHEGDPTRCMRLIVRGWACRYKLLKDGRRQIVGFVLPGDICGVSVFVAERMDHSILALTPVEYVRVTPPDIEALTGRYPRVLRALWWDTLVNAAIQREWAVNLGQRSAIERLAHLLSELFERLRVVGMTRGPSYELPVSQGALADALGTTPVHVSRTFTELKRRNLVRLQNRLLEILDRDALCELCLFDPDYLHLNRERVVQA